MSLKKNSLSDFGIWSWSNQFNLGFILVTGGNDHPVTGESSNTSRLEVVGDNYEARHVVDLDEFLKTGGDFSDLSVPHIDLLAVEVLTLGVFPALDDLSYSEIELSELFESGFFLFSLLGGILRLSLGWLLLLLRLLGLFFLFRSLLFLLSGLFLGWGLFLFGLFLLFGLLFLGFLRLGLLFLLLLLEGLSSQFWVSSLGLFGLFI